MIAARLGAASACSFFSGRGNVMARASPHFWKNPSLSGNSGAKRMRSIGLGVTALALMVAVMPAQARDISKNDVQVCKWGSGVAGAAQQSKLSGTTLYSARKKLQSRKYAQPWMRKMALGITEQTYKSPSRLKPAAVKQTYYEGCIQHDLARK